MMMSPPLITSDESFSPRPMSSSSRQHGSRPSSPASMSFNNGRYSPPCALDLTPKQSTLTAAGHMMSAYLPPAFAGLMVGSTTSSAGHPGHGPSFGPSGKNNVILPPSWHSLERLQNIHPPPPHFGHKY